MDSSLSDYASNMTLSGETLPQIMDLNKKVELLEKERDFYLSKLRHIENLCAKFGEMAKDERQAKVPIKKLAEVLYQTDEGFIEADELTYPKEEPQNLRKTSRIIDHQISFDESMDPSAAAEIPNQRKISQPTLQNSSMRLSSSPTDEEKAGMFAARRFSIKENEGEEEVSAGILDSNAHQPGNIAMEEILSVTPIIEDNDPENVFE
uniref:EB1 C-terminal domain-containing protein n=1 Tax=Acrobeloides nanus TaxID=290746 RepID=A0A914E856_9BILA